MRDASTGEPVARVSSTGVDVAGMVKHARGVGGPALRELTFHQRAAALKQLAGYLREHRDGLYQESARTGATLGDARVDVDGGIGTLFVYASKGRRELPDGVLYADGQPQRLGRAGPSSASTSTAPGPAWPCSSTPSTSPSGGCWRSWPGRARGHAGDRQAGQPDRVRDRAGLPAPGLLGRLPPGSVQLLCGGVGDLFDHLGGQDAVAFTGSAATARRLRAHPAVIGEAVRFNAEADSLNCSILGPDATGGTEEFDLYVGEVVRELTQKTGQKCTAIRRCLVPAGQVRAVVDALGDRLAGVRVGDPRDEATTMGPLVSRDQQAEVGQAVARLGRGAEVAVGGAGGLDLASGDPDRGAFFAPTVLVAGSPGAPELHQVEAFGPVTSVIGYRDAAEAVELAALGREAWSAPSSPTTPASPARSSWASPWHGRLLVLDQDDAAESTGHGARCRTWSTAAPAGPAAARSWAGSGRSCTTCRSPASRPRRPW